MLDVEIRWPASCKYEWSAMTFPKSSRRAREEQVNLAHSCRRVFNGLMGEIVDSCCVRNNDHLSFYSSLFVTCQVNESSKESKNPVLAWLADHLSSKGIMFEPKARNSCEGRVSRELSRSSAEVMLPE